MANIYGMTCARLLGSLLENPLRPFARPMHRKTPRSRVGILALALLVPSCIAQEPAKAPAASLGSVNTTLPVNWIYGAYIPKDAPIVPLTGHGRFKLYLRQTYTTPGIYVKTGLFAIHDQAKETEPGVGGCFSGFAKRVGSSTPGMSFRTR